MATTLNAATFMGKNFSTIQIVVKNHESLTLKQMFDVTAQLANNQEEINGLDNFVEKEFLDTSARKSVCSRILSCASERFFNIPNPTKLGRTELQESNPGKATEIMMLSTESRLNSSGTFSQLSQRCSSVIKINDLLSNLGQTPATFTGRILFMSMFNDISCDRKGNKDECLKNAESVKAFARRFGIGQWSFIGPGSEKKWYSSENSLQGAWDNIAEQMLLEFAESGHPISVQRHHCPGVYLRAKGEENCLYTSLQIKTQLIQFIALFFLSISSVSTEQWQLYAKNLRAIKIDRENLRF